MLKSRVWEGPPFKCKYYPRRTMLKSRVIPRVPHPGASIILRRQCLNHVCERVHSAPSVSIILRGQCLNHVCERVPCASKCKYYPNRTMLKSRVCEGPSSRCKYYPKRTMLMISTCVRGSLAQVPSIILRGRCLNHVCVRVPHPKRMQVLSLSRIPVLSNHDVWEDDILCAPSASIILRGRCLNHDVWWGTLHPSTSIILGGQCLNHVCERVHSRTSASIILRGRCLRGRDVQRVPHPSASIIPRGQCLNHVCDEGPLCIQVQLLSEEDNAYEDDIHVCTMQEGPSPKCKYYPKRTMPKSRVWEGPLCTKCKNYPKRTMLKSRVWEGPFCTKCKYYP